MSIEAHSAERAILSILIQNPDSFFDINDVLVEADFCNTGAAMIYSIIREIILNNKDARIDTQLILAEAERKNLDNFLYHTLNGELIDALMETRVNKLNIKMYVSAVKQASIKRTLINTCSDLQDAIEDYTGTSLDLRNTVENTILDSLRVIDSGEDDIQCMADGFEECIETYADTNGEIGIDINLPRYQRDIGYIRNGTITGLFASTKVGKSQFSLWAAYQTAIIRRLPVLYLDTELQLRQQQMRLCGIMTRIPYNIIESGRFRGSEEQYSRVKNAYSLIKGAPIFYKNIAGRSVHSVIPTIRKFVYQQMGGPVVGDEPKGLVIYDYIKLMDASDMADKMQEYQLIGLLMSSLHDCASHLNIPIIALGQLNKQEDIGIRRIVENVDSASILRPKRQEELAEDGAGRGTHVLDVKWSRNGPGHNFGEWINVNFDKSCGQFIEDKRNSEVVTIVKRLKEELMKKQMDTLGNLKEESEK